MQYFHIFGGIGSQINGSVLEQLNTEKARPCSTCHSL